MLFSCSNHHLVFNLTDTRSVPMLPKECSFQKPKCRLIRTLTSFTGFSKFLGWRTNILAWYCAQYCRYVFLPVPSILACYSCLPMVLSSFQNAPNLPCSFMSTLVSCKWLRRLQYFCPSFLRSWPFLVSSPADMPPKILPVFSIICPMRVRCLLLLFT